MQRQRDRGLARDIEGVGEEDLLLDLAQQRACQRAKGLFSFAFNPPQAGNFLTT
jgi:endonuclease YncB( thermonuclease family)